MKKLLLAITITTVILQTTTAAFAATTTKPTPTPTGSQSITQIEQQINNLKDKIASRVAQLKLVEKRGIIGTVTDVSETQITLKDIQGNIHFVDVDELTSFSSPTKNSNFGISDITKNMTLGVLGLYNKDSRRLLARFVTVTVVPQHITGAIAAIDKKNYNVTVVQNDGKQLVVEIEDITKTTSFDKTTDVTKSGFSKMTTGERIYVVGYPDKQDTTQLIASRIILFPNLPINPAIGNAMPQPTPTDTPIPTPTLATRKTSTAR